MAEAINPENDPPAKNLCKNSGRTSSVELNMAGMGDKAEKPIQRKVIQKNRLKGTPSVKTYFEKSDGNYDEGIEEEENEDEVQEGESEYSTDGGEWGENWNTTIIQNNERARSQQQTGPWEKESSGTTDYVSQGHTTTDEESLTEEQNRFPRSTHKVIHQSKKN